MYGEIGTYTYTSHHLLKRDFGGLFTFAEGPLVMNETQDREIGHPVSATGEGLVSSDNSSALAL